MIKKIQLLLSSAEPQNSDKLADLLVKEWEAVKQALPGIQHRRAIRVPGDPTRWAAGRGIGAAIL